MPVTLKDIAEKCGMSRATVANILSRSNRYSFKQETVELVWSTAKALNYRPNILASNLRKQENRIILCIVGWACRHSDVTLLKALEHEVGKRGYNMVIQFLVELPDPQKLEFLERLINWPAAIIIEDLGIREPRILKKAIELLQTAPPTVALFSPYEGSGVDYFSIDWRTEKRELVEYLKGKNVHSLLCCSAEHEKKLFTKLMEFGQSQGIKVEFLTSPALSEITEYYRMGQVLGGELLKMKKLPDALYCISDEMAFSIIEILRKRGVRIPEDLIVVGGGDSEFCQWLNPPMPVLVHDIESTAKTVVEYLMERLASGAQDVGSGKCFATGEQHIRVRTESYPPPA